MSEAQLFSIGLSLVGVGFTAGGWFVRNMYMDVTKNKNDIQDFQVNYIDRFAETNENMAKLEMKLTNEIHDSKHELLNAMQRFTEQRVNDTNEYHATFADKAEMRNKYNRIEEKLDRLISKG